ncbi:MAG: 3-hydroxy-3-methylglutaryl-CoA reductase, partial [Candidatus Altiarchaeota archaeon]|nr:3-hydroxy-3-methylglutaryl-CoA reductase [Candidatus Altiarchaeota archaeon]
MEKTSNISGFYKLSPEARLKLIRELADLTEEEAGMLANTGALGMGQVDRMVENVIGTVGTPFGVGLNFLINGKDYIVPMATEEPSVIAAASNAAKMARAAGGFRTSSTEPVMIGQ